MENNNTKKFLKTKDAAAFLGVSPAWLKANRLGRTNAPKIPCLVINAKNVKYLLADLESYTNKLETIYKQDADIVENLPATLKDLETIANDKKAFNDPENKMEIHLTEIYKGLAEWRAERGITAESQKEGYLVNVMEELGELSAALRLFEKSKRVNDSHELKCAEHFIIDALCDISVFTINAGADIPTKKKETLIDISKVELNFASLRHLIIDCGNYDIYECNHYFYFNSILKDCAKLCEHYGFDFQIAMDETIKEISSRIGAYDENAKKWVKDESDEARAKWYQADYEKARIEK